MADLKLLSLAPQKAPNNNNNKVQCETIGLSCLSSSQFLKRRHSVNVVVEYINPIAVMRRGSQTELKYLHANSRQRTFDILASPFWNDIVEEISEQISEQTSEQNQTQDNEV